MPDITISQALGKYTSQLEAVYRERIKPTGYLRSKFPTKIATTKLVSIMVQRGFEKIAVDAARGTEGNRNKWTLSTQKIFEPLYFRENFDLTQLQLYDNLFSEQNVQNAPMIAALINSIVENQIEQQEKIERAIEVMCAQVLMTGVIQMSTQGTGITIDYRRQAASLVDSGAGQYFANNIDPFAQAQADATFLRQAGKTMKMTFDWIMGETAAANFFANTVFTGRQNLFHLQLDGVVPSEANETTGAVYHGWITAGPYRVNLWTYPQYYDDPITGIQTPYIDTKKCVMLPADPNFFTFFGAVPQVVLPTARPIVGDFIQTSWMDAPNRAYLYETESCPLPVPVAIDQMITRKCVA